MRREVVTLMFADIVESVQIIEREDAGAIARIRRLLDQLGQRPIPAHGGQTLEIRGDGLDPSGIHGCDPSHRLALPAADQ